MTVHRWSFSGRPMVRHGLSQADHLLSSTLGSITTDFPHLRHRSNLNAVLTKHFDQEQEPRQPRPAQSTTAQEPAVSRQPEAVDRLSPSIPTTTSTVSGDYGLDFFDCRPSTELRGTSLLQAPKRATDELESLSDILNAHHEDNERARSSSSSYRSENLPSPAPGQCSSPQPTTYTMSIGSNQTAYTNIPSDVGSYLDALYSEKHAMDVSQGRPTLMDELAAAATAMETSTTHTTSILDLAGSSIDFQPSRSGTRSTEVDALYLQTRSKISSHGANSRRERSSEGSALPSTANLIWLLYDNSFLREVPERESVKELLAEVTDDMNHTNFLPENPRRESDAIVGQWHDADKLSMNQHQLKANAAICCNAAVSSVSDDRDSMIDELPPLTKVNHHVSSSEYVATDFGHSGIKAWVKYALCRTKVYCKMRLGRQPSAESAKNLVLFKTFRILKQSRVASERKPRKCSFARSLRLDVRTWA
ncbi:uncharacterized protein B0I36DRAFT_120223 [Microdochium trichocladiopsis]|uniref:Uncharacterized protein n=1 Tax=Microdochium trichocladiopsis TaxID=1682393 RepID=A0A9P8Y7B7_9PEZI|nr:uncharacterized protein B0I36DRAFT_120223 [Microdochium trichocladiopsis]KAH7031228.1 hypothetical protein B0I36DRAFT_120223 [Microdochium trichocladiopsis]